MNNKFNFRKANISEANSILELYNNLIDKLDKDINYPKWTRDLYPDLNYIKNKIENNELFLLLDNEKIVGSCVLNTDRIKDYKNVNWTLPNLPEEEILTIHTFAIREEKRGMGLGKKFIHFIENYAKEKNFKSIHLDTIYSNTPAVSFYESLDFKNLGEYPLHYKETDETRFILFEKDLI